MLFDHLACLSCRLRHTLAQVQEDWSRQLREEQIRKEHYGPDQTGASKTLPKGHGPEEGSAPKKPIRRSHRIADAHAHKHHAQHLQAAGAEGGFDHAAQGKAGSHSTLSSGSEVLSTANGNIQSSAESLAHHPAEAPQPVLCDGPGNKFQDENQQ